MKTFFAIIGLMYVMNAQSFSMNDVYKSLKKVTSPSSSSRQLSKDDSSGKSYLEIENPANGNHEIKNFSEAKKLFKKTHYLGQTKTLYCNCQMTEWNRFSGDGCSYKNKKYEKQWMNIEAEHLVPFSQILSGTKAYKQGIPEICGTDKGRKCADKVYGFLAGDLWILAPAELELNRVHSNYQWAELGSKGEQFGSCDFFYEDKKVQPPMHLKGKIARAYLYVQETYKVKVISDKNKKLFDIWATYAPSPEQCQIAKQIIKYQKNSNDFEVEACKKAHLW